VIKSRPPEFAYEPELIMAANDLVMLWGRFSGHGAGIPWIVVNIYGARGRGLSPKPPDQAPGHD
jgi:hypothetical protein